MGDGRDGRDGQNDIPIPITLSDTLERFEELKFSWYDLVTGVDQLDCLVFSNKQWPGCLAHHILSTSLYLAAKLFDF